MKKIILVFVLIFFCSAGFTPRVLAAEYLLTSSDGQVKVILDGKFGGAITQLYDYANMGSLNLIDGYQAGAMFQTAFWILPYHNYQPPYVNNDSRIPPGCAGSGDQFLDNPTQAGYVADGRAGNPIGIMGTDTSAPDSNEFINYEDNNKTIHFKTRFIRYDYCKNGSAPMSERQWWDTDFYLEQWASFQPNLPRTLVLRNKITYTGTGQKSTTTRQLPVIFACNLPRVAYWQQGQKVINLMTEGNINPDINWAALIASDKEVGIGMVTSGTMSPMLGRGKFGYGQILGSTSECVNNGPLSVVYPGAGVPDLRNFGTLSNVDGPTEDHVFTFNPGGSFEWTTYYPVGTLDMIKQNSESILAGMPAPSPKTCSVSLSATTINQEQSVTANYSGNNNGTGANDTVKLWIERSDGGTISSIGSCNSGGSCNTWSGADACWWGCHSGTPSQTHSYLPSNGGGGASCTSNGNTACNGNYTFSGLPVGDYIVHCDLQQDPGKCSGDPFCTFNGGSSESCDGWKNCSGQVNARGGDNAAFTVTAPASVTISNLRSLLQNFTSIFSYSNLVSKFGSSN